VVGADSDRTALRLTGPTLPRSTQDDSPPEGLVRGAIQLPPSGQPVVMLADHPVTGGYPAIGALDDVSCDLAAQLRPGDRVRLVQLRW
jgi:allophanate hydrolase subunit 2